MSSAPTPTPKPKPTPKQKAGTTKKSSSKLPKNTSTISGLLPEMDEKKLRLLFDNYDVNRDGNIEEKELFQWMTDLNNTNKQRTAADTPTQKDAAKIIKAHDKDGDKNLQFDELFKWVQGCVKLTSKQRMAVAAKSNHLNHVIHFLEQIIGASAKEDNAVQVKATKEEKVDDTAKKKVTVKADPKKKVKVQQEQQQKKKENNVEVGKNKDSKNNAGATTTNKDSKKKKKDDAAAAKKKKRDDVAAAKKKKKDDVAAAKQKKKDAIAANAAAKNATVHLPQLNKKNLKLWFDRFDANKTKTLDVNQLLA